MRLVLKGFAAVTALAICMTTSCSNWKTTEVAVLDVVTVTNAVTISLPCALLKTAEQLEPFSSLPELTRTDLTKTNWVYSTLPVRRLRYSSEMNLIFLVPSESKKTSRVYFLAIPRTDAVDVKMTAVE